MRPLNPDPASSPPPPQTKIKKSYPAKEKNKGNIQEYKQSVGILFRNKNNKKCPFVFRTENIF